MVILIAMNIKVLAIIDKGAKNFRFLKKTKKLKLKRSLVSSKGVIMHGDAKYMSILI